MSELPIYNFNEAKSTSFSDSHINEAKSIIQNFSQEKPGDKDRLDLTSLKTYAIDDEKTYEIDDAISLEFSSKKPIIWIHIADPCREIKAGSFLDDEAQKRVSSLYLVDGIKPMFPLELIDSVLGLKAGCKRAALSTAITLDKEANISSVSIHRTWIRPSYFLTYSETDELIDLDPPEDKEVGILSSLLQKRYNKRVMNGAIPIEQTEGRFIRDSQNQLKVKIIENSPSRRMVSESMILMGTAIANFGRINNISLPYRTQLPSSLPESSHLLRLPVGPVRNSAIKFRLNRGCFATEPDRHFSLGLDAYVQITSPLRRYVDLLAHRQIIAFLEDQIVLSKEQIRDKIRNVEQVTRELNTIMREDQKKYLIRWLLTKPNDLITMVFLKWMKMDDKVALVYIEKVAIELICELEILHAVEPGSKMQLKVLLADADHGSIILTDH